NIVANTIFARGVAVTGRYKCAVYSDVAGLPIGLLRDSAETTNPTSGWKSFPLTSPLTLTNGQYYWLAIWSDAANAAAYYVGTGNGLRFANYTYGAWPDPITTTGGAALNYCIYASGTVAT